MSSNVTEATDWSDEFWMSHDGEAGYITVSLEDDRKPSPPAGWVEDEVFIDGDEKCYIFVRVS